MSKPYCDKKGNKKGVWTAQEDQKLITYIQTHGEGCWRNVPKAGGLQRCGKSCRLRWINYLRPGIKRGKFGQDEEDLIIKLHALLGNRWSLISGRLPGRTDNEVKNYWNSHIKRKLISKGIDPNNHRLKQTVLLVPCLQNQCKSAHVNSSFGSLSDDDAAMPSKTLADNDRVSDSASCLEGYTSGSNHLTVAILDPSPKVGYKERRDKEVEKERQDKEIESDRFPTLILFR